MNESSHPAPAIRSWRDIAQPVKPRAMSRGGRWRRTMEGVRVVFLVVIIAAFLAGTWFVVGALSRTPKHLPEVGATAIVRHLELKNSAGGVLDLPWLERTLALPPQVTLVDLDLEKLRSRLMAERQVASATVTRQFPDRLIVRLSERMPVARVRVEFSGEPRDLLVASDGVVFEGTGFEPAMLASLPWLSGIKLVPDGAGFQPIAGMAIVTQLLADAQFSALRLYQNWMTVSLAKLAADREIEVTTKNGTTVVFNASGDFFVQLATLDYLTEKLSGTPMARARIDLTLGRNVPVLIEPPAAETGPRPAAKATAATLPARPFPPEILLQR